MSVLTFPQGIYPSSCDWRLKTRSAVFESPFNGGVQTLEMPGAYWEAALTFTNLKKDKAAELDALILALDGMAGRLFLWDHAFATPRGPAGGVAVVDGGPQAGTQLAIRGCTPDQLFLKKGDYFQTGAQLCRLTEDATADGAGKTVLNFRAAIRAAASDGQAIVTTQPKALMMLADDNQAPRRSGRSLVLSSFTLKFREDIYG
ncbi:hypothetical protein PVT67_11635 [Gallaecimonas kandeliae]|uniref:hypothetical protein n=1 Tax=Gallaecimonas kandeliae TaxID=3029055 RepID=UPI00264922B0|nr:hypothetical protein [Gallaecimonas kandeliae]WKE64331.1 hypothetical protein PVT67_11635 [Gallaecimonas kandeliae]